MANPQSKQQQSQQIPHCYYEGYLEKRSAKEKVSQRLWASLCGNTLFFYNTIKDAEVSVKCSEEWRLDHGRHDVNGVMMLAVSCPLMQYVDRIDLDGFVSLLDDNSRDRNLEAARFQLRTKEGEFKITVPTLENRELWKGFIHAVAELSLPSTLNLLPGQVHMLQEVVEKERERQLSAAVQENLYLSLVADMPPCFHEVSRREAMSLLEKYPDCGNMLLRPSKDGSMAVTTRQDLNGSVFHHYRVIRRPEGGFVINLETPIPCASLYEVIKCLEEKTSGVLQPFILDNIYNDNITLVQQNDENGEKKLQPITGSPSLKTPPSGNQKPTVSPDAKSFSRRCNDGSNEMQESRHPACASVGPSKTVNAKESKSIHTGSGKRAPMPLPKFVRKFVSPVQDSLPSNSSSEDQSSGTDQHHVTVPSMSAKTCMHNKQAIPKPSFAMATSPGDLPLGK
uniref:Signal transducing adaptor family member 2b n=1 Tax=Paramormyrops kingsleyae TaxID=1676925 RepID=A0A3B3T6G4_9TELE